MDKNAWKDEKQVSPCRLPGQFAEEDAKCKAKRHEYEGIYKLDTKSGHVKSWMMKWKR